MVNRKKGENRREINKSNGWKERDCAAWEGDPKQTSGQFWTLKREGVTSLPPALLPFFILFPPPSLFYHKFFPLLSLFLAPLFLFPSGWEKEGGKKEEGERERTRRSKIYKTPNFNYLHSPKQRGPSAAKLPSHKS